MEFVVKYSPVCIGFLKFWWVVQVQVATQFRSIFSSTLWSDVWHHFDQRQIILVTQN